MSGAGAPPRQLVLRFDSPPRYEEDEFLVAMANESAFSYVARWPDWPDCAAVLVGPKGSGKSHLAAIWARRAHAINVDSAAFSDSEGLGQYFGRNIVLENAQDLASERGLFHLINMVREAQAFILMTAETAPDAWGVGLPDLRSRLRRAPILELGYPDEFLVRAILVKLFADRQLSVDQAVIEHIALRVGRSIDRARQFVEAIDLESLALGRRVTRVVAAAAFSRLDSCDDDA